MEIITKTVEFSTAGRNDMLDITQKVQEQIDETKIKLGTVLVFCPGSTGALSTVEFEPGLQKDIPDALERIAPYGPHYAHHDTWNDDNGSGHIKATLLGPDLTVPIIDGKLVLGQWQQIVFIECDTRGRRRELILQITGNK